MRWERPTKDQKAILLRQRLKQIEEWRYVFAWRPVMVSPGKFAWLERVWRRARVYHGEDGREGHSFLFGYSHFYKRNNPEPYLIYWQYKADTLEFLKDEETA